MSQVKKLKKGGTYKIVVRNINMNLYNVQVNHKDSLVVSNAVFPTLDLIGLDAINSVISNIVQKTTSAKENEIESNLINNELAIQSRRKKYNENLITVNIYDKSKQDLGSKHKMMSKAQHENEMLKIQVVLDSALSKTVKLKREIDSLEFEKVKFLNEIKKIEEIKKTENPKTYVLNKIETEKKNIKRNLMKSKIFIEKADSLITRINNQSLAYLVSVDTSIYISKHIFESTFSYNRAIDFSQLLSNALKGARTLIIEQEKNYTDSILKVIDRTEILVNDTLVKLKNIELQESFSKSLSILDKAIDKVSFEKISAHFLTLIHLENNSKREYVSIPLQHNQDVSLLRINITPKKPEYGQSYSAEYQFPKTVAYTGVGGSFYFAGNMRNDVYSVSETSTSDTTSVFNIVNEGGQKGELGFASLLHVGCRLKCLPLLGFNGVIGPALSLSNAPQLRMCIGAGILLGSSRNMFSINGLLVGGNVQRRSVVFHENVNYLSKPDQITISKLTKSWAISMGYIYKF